MNADSRRYALPIGRVMRFLVGAFFIYEIHDVYLGNDLDGILIRAAWAVALVLFYILLHSIIRTYTPNVNPILGAILAFGPVIAVFVLGYGGPAATGALTFLAVTLIVAGIRADPGCEVMSIPALFSGRHTHLFCLLFSPLDWVERKVTQKH